VKNAIFVNVKKVKFLCAFLTKHHTMKVDRGSGGIAPSIDLGTRWR
jgi:hypothetical protein